MKMKLSTLDVLAAEEMLVAPEEPLFKPGRNCWRVETASHASMLIDCANYYRAVYDAISKAKHSIFILGWDIDSRIDLLRGDDALNAKYPVRFFDLIQAKARENPFLKIYLNRWDFSIFFASQRECLSALKWRLKSPPNVYYCFDAILPVSACHHQKVVVVDDEVAFCGGMDIALFRWDIRHHQPDDDRRTDPGGMNNLIRRVPFGPYHDIMIAVGGEAAQALALHCRERWRLAAGFDPVPIREVDCRTLPPAWPFSAGIQFENVPLAIAFTNPPMYGKPAVRQIEQMYIDMVNRAENFIYMENQYYTSMAVAEAINENLRRKPKLRALLVGCYDPNGRLEMKSMWTGRIKFQEALVSGGMEKRAVMAWPVSCNKTEEKDVHIHSKIVIVDDKYLRVGSSNLNNRSMGFDTECDVVIEATDDKSRSQIAFIRNDLIREHTGKEMPEIENLVANSPTAEPFLNYVGSSRQHLRRINDQQYRYTRFQNFALWIGDPLKPIIPGEWTMPYRYAGTKRNLPRRLIFTLLILAALVAIGFAWQPSSNDMGAILDHIKNSPWSAAIVLGVFVLGSLLFFPLTAMIAATAAVFGPAEGFALAMSGTLLGAAAGYGLGRVAGLRTLRFLIGATTDKITQFVQKAGILGVTMIRTIPVAPFTAVNYALGITSVPFSVYILGTFFGVLPGIAALSFLGDSIAALWKDPTPKSILMLGLGVAAWLGVLTASHFFVRRWQEKNAGKI